MASREGRRKGATQDPVTGQNGQEVPQQVIARGEQVEARHAGSETEGLCDSMPDLGTLPLQGGAASARKVVRLVSTQRDGGELSIELQQGVNRVGRQRVENHIVLASPDVSRFHAEVEVRPDTVLVRDLGSTNGTFVGGQRVTEQVLQAGDIVSFSDKFSFRVLVDIALQSPRTMTLQGTREAPLPGRMVGREAARAGSAARAPLPLQARHTDVLDQVQRDKEQESPVTPVQAFPSLKRPAPLRGPQLPQELFADDNAQTRAATGPPGQQQDLGLGPRDILALEQERRQHAILFQISRRCLAAESLGELERLLINVLERMVPLERGFITYQLPSGDWKLVMTSRGHNWSRDTVRSLLHLALRSRDPVEVEDSRTDATLGQGDARRGDARLLIPLRRGERPMGALFIIASPAGSLPEGTASFLALFADVAALALVNCSRLEQLSG